MGKLLLALAFFGKMISSDNFLWGFHKHVLGLVHGAMGEERCSSLLWYPCSDDVS